MIKLSRAALIIIGLALFGSQQAQAGINHGGAPLARGAVICDLTTGVATGVGAGTCVAHPATCNGVADDAQAFADFSTWVNLTWQTAHTGLVELYIPSGKTCALLSTVNLTASLFDPGCAGTYPFTCFWNSSNFSKGISQFLLNFYGASITAGSGVVLVLNGGDGVCHNGIATGAQGCSARTATVSSGATSVTLLDVSLCSRFTTGRWVVMTGFAVQSQASAYGYPPNFAFYDYVIITDKTNCATTGQITFDRALTNDYKSTWPVNNGGIVGEADQGGAATLYALPFWWNSEAEYRGGTIDNTPNQTNGAGRKTTFRDFTWVGTACAYPTQTIDWIVIGGGWSNCQIEMDKIVVNATFQNTQVDLLHHQSPSPRYLTVTGTTMRKLVGTPRNITLSNSHITGTNPTTERLQFGSSFGSSSSFNCTNCVIDSTIDYGSASESGTVTAGNWSISGQGGGPYTATMTNGIITVPNAHGALTWGTPGSNFVWSYGGYETAYFFQILDVTQDATNQYFTTNCVGVNTVCGAGGGLPVSSGGLNVLTHPMPKFNCTNCTSAVGGLIGAYGGGPVDAPLFSYVNYAADVTFPISSTDYVRLWGTLGTLTFTVTNPYAGAGALSFFPLNQFSGPPQTKVRAPDGTLSSYVPKIDLKVAGTRVVTSSGVTGGGGTDALTLPIPAGWYGVLTAPNISSHPAWAGTLGVTMQTNQGVVP